MNYIFAIIMCVFLIGALKTKKANAEIDEAKKKAEGYKQVLNNGNMSKSPAKPAPKPAPKAPYQGAQKAPSKPATAPAKPISKAPSQNGPQSPFLDAKPSKQLADKNTRFLMEDRNNDWLANQLREEHKAFKRTKDMFNLKIEHSSHCDARYVKQLHANNCDAKTIGTAQGH